MKENLKIVSIKAFIESGSFGGVSLGTSTENVMQLLGTPDEDCHYGKESGGLVYGWYEFFYNRKTGVVNGIQNDHLLFWDKPTNRSAVKQHAEGFLFQNETFRIDPWLLKAGNNLKYKDIVGYLTKKGMEFTEVTDSITGYLICFPSGVKMDFHHPDYDWTDTASLGYADKQELFLNGIRLFEPV